MTSAPLLPKCCWRDSPDPDERTGRYTCRSTRFVGSPNQVSSEFCGRCAVADHPEPDPLPPALPCVHLGGVPGDSARSDSRAALFDCSLYGRCDPSWTSDAAAEDTRRCVGCVDYLPRDPFGPNSRQMHERAEAFLAAIPPYPVRRFRGRGVVIAAGGDRFFASLYVTLRALRHVGCELPIQVWYLGRHGEMPPKRRALLAPYDVRFVDADAVRRKYPARTLNGWELKVFAALHCPFREVLSLDADSYPCRDPEFLFDRDDYKEHGAIFWPDMHERDARLKWKAFGVPDPMRLGSVESGQFLIDKRLCWRPLNLAWFYNDHSDFYYRYAFGDKHTFEVSWERCRQRFVMWKTRADWEDVAYVHSGPTGEPLFVHRCSDKFRFKSEAFSTRHASACPKFVPKLPLESEGWNWLGDLATELDSSRRPGRVAPRRIVRVGLPDHFNCSLIAHGGRLLLASRVGEIAPRICLSELDRDFQPARTWPLDFVHPRAERGVEDPRLFLFRDRLHCAFTGIDSPSEPHPLHQMIARIGDDGHVEKVVFPQYADRSRLEKNWQFFEVDGELQSVYSIQPHVILKHRGQRVVRAARTDARLPRSGGHLRGGAPPVRCGDEYYCFFHATKEAKGQFVYAMGVYTFAAASPFAIRRYARPFFAAADHDRTPGYNKSVVFPCGALRREDAWIISYGYHDRECRIAIFDAADIERILKPVRSR